MHADFLMFVAHFYNSEINKVFKDGFETFKGGIPFDNAAKMIVLNQFGGALDPFRLGVRRSDFFDFLDELEKTIMEKLNFGFQNNVISKFNELIDLFVLFTQNGLLTVYVAFLVVFFVMIPDIVNFNIVLEFEFFDFFVDCNFKLFDDHLFDFLDFWHEVGLNVLFCVCLELLRVLRFHGIGGQEVDWFFEVIRDFSDLK